jgi:hypothetical protein
MYGVVTRTTGPLLFHLGNHQEILKFYIITLAQHPIILGLSWFKAHDPTINWCNHSITFTLQSRLKISTVKANSNDPASEWLESVFGAQFSIRVGSRSKVDRWSCPSLNKGNHASCCWIEHCKFYADNYQPLSKYEDFQDMFEKKNVDCLPEHLPYDCLINFQEGVNPPFGPIYGLSELELRALRIYIDENLKKGFM